MTSPETPVTKKKKKNKTKQNKNILLNLRLDIVMKKISKNKDPDIWKDFYL